MVLQVNNESLVFFSMCLLSFLHLDILTIDFNGGKSFRLIDPAFKTETDNVWT